MIAALLRQRTRTHADTLNRSNTDAARAETICSQARELLKPFANISEEEATPHKLHKIWPKAGGLDGMGILLRLAEVETAGGSLSPEAMAIFVAHGEVIIELLQSVSLNFTVIFSLFLTIYISILVMHAGNPAYAYDVASRELGGIAFGSGDHSGAWYDLASYAWPGDADAQRSLRRHLYLAEVCTSYLLLTPPYLLLTVTSSPSASNPTGALAHRPHLRLFEGPYQCDLQLQHPGPRLTTHQQARALR